MKHCLPILAVAGLVSMFAVKPTPAFSADHRSTIALERPASEAVAIGSNTQAATPLRRRPAAQRIGNSKSAPNLMMYVLTNDPVSGAPSFGVADPATGGFAPIGVASALPPDLGHGLLPATGTSFLSLGLSGNLYAIEPRTGKASLVGATGLGDCTTPESPCGWNSANTVGYLAGQYYALDFSQNLYSLDSSTGAAKLIGPTGIPVVTIVPGSIDGGGKLNLYFESVFSFRGKLYTNFDESQLDLSTGSLTAVVPAALYEIDPRTGHATMIAPTAPGLLTIVNVNDTIYAFDAPNGRFLRLDVPTGQTRPVSDFDPAAGLVCGAAPAHPNPSSNRP